MEIVGGCLCGQVRYRGSAAPVFTAVCHCKHCQKQSGTSFSVVLGLPSGSLAFEGAPMRTYHDTGASGQPVERRFCPNCGSAIVTDAAAAPALTFLKAGTLDDTSSLQPQMEIWCDHAQPWVAQDPSRARLPANPPLG